MLGLEPHEDDELNFFSAELGKMAADVLPLESL